MLYLLNIIYDREQILAAPSLVAYGATNKTYYFFIWVFLINLIILICRFTSLKINPVNKYHNINIIGIGIQNPT